MRSPKKGVKHSTVLCPFTLANMIRTFHSAASHFVRGFDHRPWPERSQSQTMVALRQHTAIVAMVSHLLDEDLELWGLWGDIELIGFCIKT